MHGGADVVSAGLLLDRRGDNGRVRDAGLVEAVRRRGHHVRRETAGDQAEGGGTEWSRDALQVIRFFLLRKVEESRHVNGAARAGGGE